MGSEIQCLAKQAGRLCSFNQHCHPRHASPGDHFARRLVRGAAVKDAGAAATGTCRSRRSLELFAGNVRSAPSACLPENCESGRKLALINVSKIFLKSNETKPRTPAQSSSVPAPAGDAAQRWPEDSRLTALETRTLPEASGAPRCAAGCPRGKGPLALEVLRE